MKDWKEFLQELKKRGWILEQEDNHSLVFSHKKYGKVIFTIRCNQKTILAGLKDMEELYKKERKNGKMD